MSADPLSPIQMLAFWVLCMFTIVGVMVAFQLASEYVGQVAATPTRKQRC